MADRILFVGWGTTIAGREERALEVFNSSIAFYGRCQQEGKIESFDVTLLEPHGGDLAGYAELHGSAQQLADLRDDEEFRRLLVDANLIVERLGLVGGYVNEGVARQVQMFQEAIAEVPQTTG
jgi:hypothetical protein